MLEQNMGVDVIKDFHIVSLSSPIMFILYESRHPSEFGYYVIKFDNADTQKNFVFIESTWGKPCPENPFVSHF